MKKVQSEYIELKAKYDAAFKAEQWEIVDHIEDALLDAEFALFDWAGAILIETGKMKKEDVALLRNNANGDKWEKVLNLASRLTL